ncbi:MAG: OmpA family protein [Bacteroidota bacterium]|nr:OmpA family protein [Bacteroidota bacterium]
MKRILLFIFTSLFIITAYPENKGFSRWSFVPEYGYNYFDGDINQNLTNLFPTSFRNITFGATLEYALTPIWGLGLDYFFFPLRANNNSPAPIAINTDLYTSDFNATLNFTRWIFPNSKSKFYINGSIGIGFAYYTFDVRYANGNKVLASDTYVDQKYNGQIRPILLCQNQQPMKYGLAGSVPVSFSVEYNFSRPLAIGAKVQYRAYTKDNLEGVTNLNWDGVTNDFVAAGTLFLRYKFNSIKKNHLRNINWNVYQPDEGLLLAKNLEKKFDKLKGKVDSIGNKVDSLIPRVAKLENILSNDGPDSDGDGVPDVRDLEPNTPANTPVDFWGRTLKIPVNTSRQGGSIDDIPAVYFDFDRIDLDDNALVAISKVAAKMNADPSLYVEVRGYCDYMGNNPYNNLLSQRRSDRVKAELVKMWKIPFDHIISNGKGKVIEPRLKYRPNRRCDFFFGKL